MPEQVWFLVNDAWQVLGFKNARALRYWIAVGRENGWLREGKEIKRRNPTAARPTWLIHIQRCQDVGTKPGRNF